MLPDRYSGGIGVGCAASLECAGLLVGGMTDAECLAAIPIVQQNIDRNDDIIKGL